VIKVVDVTQHYGMAPVLKRVSLTVERGELLSITGPNGMGKSTLLGVMAGLTPPLRGHVEVAGVRRRSSVEGEQQIRKQVVYLPTEPWLPMHRTGREFLYAVGQLYGVSTDRLNTHVDGLLKLFELDSKADADMGGYSTGQKKKISLCSGLVTDAPIMLLDEPFSGGLDPSGILALKRVLKGLARQGDRTIVLTSPVPELLEELGGRIAVLSKGELVMCDTVEGLRKQSGCDGPLGEVLEQLLHPQTLDNLHHYFETCA
jgi:ABC-type multidrug transport system ATPase subunit